MRGNRKDGYLTGLLSQLTGIYNAFSLIIKNSTSFLQQIQTNPLSAIVPFTVLIAFMLAWVGLGFWGVSFLRHEQHPIYHMGTAIINIAVIVLWFMGWIR
jgi:hypothetical protein